MAFSTHFQNMAADICNFSANFTEISSKILTSAVSPSPVPTNSIPLSQLPSGDSALESEDLSALNSQAFPAVIAAEPVAPLPGTQQVASSTALSTPNSLASASSGMSPRWGIRWEIFLRNFYVDIFHFLSIFLYLTCFSTCFSFDFVNKILFQKKKFWLQGNNLEPCTDSLELCRRVWHRRKSEQKKFGYQQTRPNGTPVLSSYPKHIRRLVTRPLL